MCTSYNGFEIAEEDLKIRGPGDFLSLSANASIRQSGDLSFRLADMCEDSELMTNAFAEARKILDSDPNLSAHPSLRDHAARMFEHRGDIIS
jgi:ATP-dependent DNA helicase RecG